MPGTKTNWHALSKALDNNDAAGIKAAAGSDLGGSPRYFDDCIWSVKRGRPAVLDALLTAGGGFNFSGKKNDFALFIPLRDKNEERLVNRERALKLIDAAYESGEPDDLLPILYKNRTKGDLTNFRPLDVADFIREDAPLTLIKAVLHADPLAFKPCLTTAGFAAVEKFAFILPYATEKDADFLSHQLLFLTRRGAEGDFDRVMMLMAHPLSTRYDYLPSLSNAALRGDRQMAELLLSRTPLEKGGMGLVKELKKRKADDAILHLVETAVERTLRGTFNVTAETAKPAVQPAATPAPAKAAEAAPKERKKITIKKQELG